MSENIRKEKETSTSSVAGKTLDSTARTIGSIDTTISGTAAEDSDTYRNHLRMSEAQLYLLLQKVSPLIQKADTFLRPALPTKLKLQISLHYLATGTCFRILSDLCRVPTCSATE
jgi:hypothetical protein